jgi:hypothetical protein
MVVPMYATAVINGTPVPRRELVPALAEWLLIWVPLTPVIMRLARRYPIAWPPAAKSLGCTRAAAVRVVAELSELLREAISRDAPDMVRLRDELAFVHR